MLERLRRDPGFAFLLLGLIIVAAVYAPTFCRGLVNIDDPWLVRDNWILADPSVESLKTVFVDTSRVTRFVLGAEYLPVRDVSIMFDRALWGDWYGGFHLTNLLVYMAAMALWFAALVELGLDRRIAGLALLLWAIHPSHAESVAWISERKGLLGAMFAGLAALGYARFRAGGRDRWIAIAALAAVAAVWSKAPAAFALAMLAPLELALPTRRQSWRRSAGALAAIAVVAGLAFVPVFLVAQGLEVVSAKTVLPAGVGASTLGLLGFYMRANLLLVRNAPSYEISYDGPTSLDIAVGAVALILVISALVPKWRVSPELRAGTIIWLVCWLPFSRLVFPLRSILVADRYMLLPTLGFCIVVAAVLVRVADGRANKALIATVIIASTLRTLDAQSNWRDGVTLWRRATESNPHDGEAWSMYVDALTEAGEPERALDALASGLRRTKSPRLMMHKALVTLEHGTRADGVAIMEQAAAGGEVRAMSNLALLFLQDGRIEEALKWARRSVAAAPLYANARRVLGKVALATRDLSEARTSFEAALALEPTPVNHFNLALALIEFGMRDEARPHLEASLADPRLAARARTLLDGSR